MRTLARAVKVMERGGTALPVPFRSWTDAHMTIRKGEISMIAGPPGSGKSTLALAIAIKTGVPTLYASMDSHESTQSLRSLAMVTGRMQHDVEQDMLASPSWASEVLALTTGHIKWMFDPSPSLGDLEDEIAVYEEVQGSDPELLIIDNAIDITHDSGDEFASLRHLMRELKFFSRETGAAVLVLHHTSESYTSGVCPPRAALHGKIAQIPSFIATINTPQPGMMAVASVKNRYGKADPSGNSAVWMEYHPESMTIKDLDS